MIGMQGPVAMFGVVAMAKRLDQTCLVNFDSPPGRPGTGADAAADAPGFAEARGRFGALNVDRARFHESIRLQQAFAAIDLQRDRDELLVLAETLANKNAELRRG